MVKKIRIPTPKGRRAESAGKNHKSPSSPSSASPSKVPKTTWLLVLLVVAMIAVIVIQLYSISNNPLPNLHSLSLQEVFPDFVQSSSSLASATNGRQNSSSVADETLQGQEQIQQTNSDTTAKSSIGSTTDNKAKGRDIGPILKILQQGGYDLTDKKLFTKETLAALPDWNRLTDFYGPPVILGLETCQAYRDSVPKRNRQIGVAGTFNSGTNLLNDVLRANCWNGNKGSGIMWQVPWGKHRPAEVRGIHYVPALGHPNVDNILPIVTLRDPYTWMQSMCRQNYAALFDHQPDSCPNIVPYPGDIEAHPRYGRMGYVPVHVKYDRDMKVTHKSMANFWNEWNAAYLYLNVTSPGRFGGPQKYPRLVVRMEDIVFRAEEVLPQICECAGFTQSEELVHHAGMSNNNPGIEEQGIISGLLRAIIKYGNIDNRKKGYPNFQLQAAKDVLDAGMMKLLQYKYEPLRNEAQP